MPFPVNYLAVLVAAAAAFFIGFMWHGPLFGKQWMALSGINEEQAKAEMAKGGMGKYMVAAFVQQFVMALVMEYFVFIADATTFWAGVQLAFMIWIGFIVTVLLNGVLWEKRSLNLYGFNVVYHLVSLIVVTGILAVWH